MRAQVQESIIEIDGLSISYKDCGAGETPVIFIHGFPFDKSSWYDQLEHLQDKRRVIAYDIRGFGKSTAGDMKASMDIFARDLIGFMDALHIRQAVICGLSMGGYIALNAVQNYPERFRGLVLCDTQSVADTPEGKEKRYKNIELIEHSGLNEFTDAFISKVFAKHTLDHKKEVTDRIRATILNTPVPTLARTLSALAQRVETSSALEHIDIPTLIICGAEDEVTPPEQSRFLHQHIKHSEYKEIPVAGHLSNLEQPAIFNRYLEEWLDSRGL